MAPAAGSKPATRALSRAACATTRSAPRTTSSGALMADAEHEATAPAYRAEITADIESCVSQMGCQPILFVGSGLSKRYFAGPSWDELLATLAKECPLI